MVDQATVSATERTRFEYDACWQRFGGIYLCQYFVAYCPVGDNASNKIAGVAAGYAGSGVCVSEGFYLEVANDGQASRLIIEAGYDALNFPVELEFDRSLFLNLSQAIRNITEHTYLLLLDWHDEDAWYSRSRLHLREDMMQDPRLRRVHESGNLLKFRTCNKPYPQWAWKAALCPSEFALQSRSKH